MNTLLNSSQIHLHRLLTQSLIVGVISAGGLLTGWMPSFSFQSATLTFGARAQAQETISAQEITNYARAVLAIEPRRIEAVKEIKGMVGSVPPVVCNSTDSINKLPGSGRGIVVNYCEQAKKIIESNNLTVSRFNAITLSQQADPNLKQRIQAEMLRLQQTSGQ